MSLREWLIAIGTLVIIGIVIDGVRRMRRARKESMAISSGMGADELKDSPLDDDFNPELPNGGARTVSRSTLEDRGYLKRDMSAPVSADQEDDVTPESGWSARDDDEDDGILSPPRVVKPEIEEPESLDPEETSTPEPEADKPKTRPTRPEKAKAEPRAEEPPVATTEVEEDTARRTPGKPRKNQPLAGANRPEAREVLVINVLARSGEQFQGSKLKSLFEACGLEHGDMDIYHRHESEDTTTPVQ
ncbi:MAG TPA: cell division protein ZipA, partial [Marinobacter hydrocarbonoclasticus]|nr:cell division protein ZipA [Marinobacter nauticus]